MKTFRNTLLIIMLIGIVFIAMGNDYSSSKYKRLVSVNHQANLSVFLDANSIEEYTSIEENLDDGLLLTCKEDYENNIEYTNVLSGLIQYTSIGSNQYVKVLGVDISDMFNDYYESDYYDSFSETRSYDLNNVNKIDISWVSGNVFIDCSEETENGKIELYEMTNTDYNNLSEKYKFVTKLIDNELKVIFRENQIVLFDENITSKNLVIKIPKNYNKPLQIKGVSCNIRIDNLPFTSMKIENVSGYVDVYDVNANNIDVYTVSGDIYLGSTISKSINLESVSGFINSELLDSYEITASSTSGNINIDVDNISGSPNTCKLKTVSGNINVY